MFQPLTQNIQDIAFPPGNDPLAAGYAVGGNAGEPSMLASISPDEITQIETPWYDEWLSISVASPEILWITGNNEVTRWNTTTSVGTLMNPATVTTSYSSISFINENEGWVAENRNVFHTADGGETWDKQTDTSGIIYLASVDFMDNLHGWVVGTIGVIKTTDGGQNWVPEYLPVDPQENWLTKVQFTSLHNGYIIGANKTLLKYTVLTGTDAQKLSDIGVKVFPNPTHGKFKIKQTAFRAKKVEIVDLSGKSLKSFTGNLNNEELEFDVSNLQPGVYLVRISSSNSFFVQKIIKF
jgi:hypothetical protein